MRSFYSITHNAKEMLPAFIPEVAKVMNREVKLQIAGDVPERFTADFQINYKDRFEERAYPITCIRIHLGQFPGCCGAAILHDLAFTGSFPIQSRDETTKNILKLTLDIAFKSGYSQLYYTTVSNQLHIIEALKFFEFKELHSFSSQRTGNIITLWNKTIADANTDKHDEIH